MEKKSHSAANYWGLIVGIISLVATVVFFLLSNKQREPVYSIVKEPSLIYDNQNSFSNFSLISEDSTLIRDNVYVTTIMLWNNGGLEIRKDDVRRDFQVSVKGGKILDHKILRQTHPKVSEFNLDKIGDELTVKWDHFDPKFGFEFQVIYSGTSETILKINGYVLGAEIKKVDVETSTNFKEIFMLIFVVFMLYMIINEFRGFSLDQWRSYIVYFILTLVTILIIISFIVSWTTRYYSPFQ